MAYYGGIPRVPSPNPNPAPPSMYRSPSPNPVPLYRSASPIPTTAAIQPQPLGANPGQIAPGTITYTTSYDPNGTLIYHPFRAVPVSYQTANGIVAGTQWVPADATTVLPAGAQPANADFAATWSNRNQPHNRDDDRALRDWQKDEDKRRRKEEKEAAKRVARAEKDRRERERESARSIYGGVPTVAGSANSGYAPTAAYGSPYASPIADLERRFENTDISRKRGSIYADPNRPASPYVPPSPIATAANPGYAPAAGYYPSGSSPYRPPGALPGAYDAAPGHPRSRAPSPIPGAGPYSSRSRAPSPVPGPAGYGAPRSRAASPMPTAYVGAGYPPPGSMRPTASPRPGETMLNQPDNVGRLPPPDAFSRPPNMAQSYTWFELMKIQNMDTFYDQLPRMPLVLVPHDVYHEDWIRFMQDLALAWAGRLPAAAGSAGTQKGSAIAIDLIELWNQAFFTQRGVDVILYRGRERKTGRRAGQIDAHIPGFDDSDLDSDDSDSSSSSLSDSEDDDRRNRYAPGVYGSSVDPYAQAELRDAKRANKEKKAEKKRRRKEKKARKKAKEREKRYALYIAALTNDDLM